MCYHPEKFNSQRHCVSGDIIFLIYQVILQDHIIKGSSDFMARSLLRELIIGGHRHSGIEDIVVSV